MMMVRCVHIYIYMRIYVPCDGYVKIRWLTKKTEVTIILHISYWLMLLYYNIKLCYYIKVVYM